MNYPRQEIRADRGRLIIPFGWLQESSSRLPAEFRQPAISEGAQVMIRFCALANHFLHVVESYAACLSSDFRAARECLEVFSETDRQLAGKR